ncbi:MAG: polysaccharide biosynthesis tyrosine autokinase [Pseudomonadota bacterium]
MAQQIINYDSYRPREPEAQAESWRPRGGGIMPSDWQMISLSELFARIRRRAVLIGLFVFIATVLTYNLVSGLTPLYQSSTQLILEPQNAAALGLEQTLGFGSLDERSIQSKMAELRSSNFLEGVAGQFGLLEVEEFNPPPAPTPAWRRALTDMGLLSEPEPVDEQILRRTLEIRMIERLRKKISVQLVGVSNVIEIGVKSENPELAARLANEIADTYITTNLETRYRAAERTAGWFADKVTSLKEDVEAAETAIASYRAENGLIETNQGDQVGQQIAELTSQLVLAETERTARETELRRILGLKGNPSQLETTFDTAGNPILQSLRDQILTKRSEVQQLSTDFGENHPTMISARNELADLQRSLAAEVERIVRDAEDNLAIAQAREERLLEILQDRQNQASTSNHARVTLATLERDAAAKRTLLEGFLGRQTEVTAQEDFLAEKPEARVIADAEPALRPIFPPTKLAVIGAFLAALVFACLLAILAEEFDNSYRSADQLERRFPNIKVVGTVPIFGRSERAPKKVAMAVIKSPNTPYAESIRSLAGRLTSHVQSDTSNNVFLFTSAEPGEGKTSTISSTARQLALNGQKTVLIDCDLRRPSLPKTFGIQPPVNGLIPYLNDQMRFDGLITTDDATSLDLIYSGGHTHDVFRLISSDLMFNMISELRRRYDIVMIDSPPVMAVDDVNYLRNFASRLLFCIRWGKTRRRTVDRALTNLLEGESSQPIELVLSRMDAVRHASYDYGDAGVYAGSNARYYSA